jgi:hypothetical protein
MGLGVDRLAAGDAAIVGAAAEGAATEDDPSGVWLGAGVGPGPELQPVIRRPATMTPSHEGAA